MFRTLLAATLLAATLLTAPPLAAPALAEEFRIGIVIPLTGGNAETGKTYLAGANAGVALVNTSGGIAGMQSRLITCDSQSVEQQAVICARKLALQDKVNLLFGAGSTPQTMAIAPTIDAAGIPSFALAAGNITYQPLKHWVFKGMAGNDDQIPVLMAYARSKGWTRAALIRDNGPFGADTSAAVKAAAAKEGLELVADEVYSTTDTDMTAQVTRIRAAKPDVVLNLAIIPPSGAMISRTVQQLGITAPIVVGTNLQTDAFAHISGDAAAQTLFVGSKVVLAETPATDPLHDNIAAFRAAFARVNPDARPSTLSPCPVDGMLLVQSVARTLGPKTLDPPALRTALESVRGFSGVQGVWTFSPDSHGSNLADGLMMVQYRAGSWVAAK